MRMCLRWMRFRGGGRSESLGRGEGRSDEMAVRSGSISVKANLRQRTHISGLQMNMGVIAMHESQLFDPD